MGIKTMLGFGVWLAIFQLFGPFASAEETVQICTFEYPLFMSKKPIQGKGYGFLIDCPNAALDAVGLKPSYHFFPMKRSIRIIELQSICLAPTIALASFSFSAVTHHFFAAILPACLRDNGFSH